MTAETQTASEIARGVAQVDGASMPGARGMAAVPGALSLPRPKPSIWRSILPAGAVLATAVRPPAPAAGAQDETALRQPAPSGGPHDETALGPPVPAGGPQDETALRPPAPAGGPHDETALVTHPEATPVDVGDGAPPVPKNGFWRRAALPAVCAAVAAFLAGSTYLALADRAGELDPDLGRWGASPMATMPAAIEGAGNAGRPPGDPFGSAATPAEGAPIRVRVAAIGLDSPLERLHLGTGGALVPPKRFEHAGWYADGTAPGDVGPAVLAGHVDSKAGPAVFYRLRELATGDRIEVVRGGTVLHFTVTRIAWYPKTKFPSAQVYGPTPDRQLRLITCGGVFDHRLRSYKDNLVVYAVAG